MDTREIRQMLVMMAATECRTQEGSWWLMEAVRRIDADKENPDA